MDGGAGRSKENGSASTENSYFPPIDFTVSSYGGPIPPVIVPLSVEAEEFDPTVRAEHALLRVLRRLGAGAVRLVQQSTALVGLTKGDASVAELDREHV